MAVSVPDEQDTALAGAFGDGKMGSETCGKLSQHSLGDVINATNSEGIMLPPEGFIRIVMKKPKGDIEGLDGIREALPGIFRDLIEEGTSSVEDGSYTPKDVKKGSGLKEVVESLKEDHSLEDGPTKVRIIKSSLNGPSIQKQANQLLKLTSTPSDQSKYLAKEYAKYQLSFLSANQKCANLVVFHNTYC